MITVTLRIKDNLCFGEKIGYKANFDSNAKISEVEKWITRTVGKDNELLSTTIKKAEL